MSTPSRLGRLSTLVCATCLTLLSTAGNPASVPERANLDGRIYAGRLLVMHTGVVLPERLQFADGLFHSSASDNFGYTDGPYSAHKVDGEILFDAFTDSPGMGWMVWHGRIRGDALSGNASARDPGTLEIQFEVHAHLVD